MRALVCNLQDAASCNIRDRLLEVSKWSEAGTFRGSTFCQRGDAVLVEVAGPTVTDEALDADLRQQFGDLDAVWFLSKHVAQSGQPSLTVHPNGNPTGEARFGGQPGEFSVAASRDMSALLRALKTAAANRELPHQVTFEATHHGPMMSLPAVFVEIGSDDTWYADVPSGQALAAAILAVLDGQELLGNGPILLGIGGGHYVPRQTDKTLAGEADFGHLLPAYAIDADAPEEAKSMLDRALAATPGAGGAYMHKKGLKGPQRELVRDWAADRGIELV